MDVKEIRTRLSSMNYLNLRKEAKRYSIRANQKKSILIDQLTKVWEKDSVDSDSQHSQKSSESIEKRLQSQNEDDNIQHKEISNTEESIDLVQLARREGVHEPFDTEERVSLDNSDRKHENASCVQPYLSEIAAEDPNYSMVSVGGRTIISNSRNKYKYGAITKKFANCHQKLLNKTSNILDDAEKIRARFDLHQDSVPETFQRLATPKRVRELVAGSARCIAPSLSPKGYDFAGAAKNASKADFNFATNKTKNFFQSKKELPGVSKIQTAKSTILILPKKTVNNKVGDNSVSKTSAPGKKQRALGRITVPKLSERLQRLATPIQVRPKVKVEYTRRPLRANKRSGALIPYVDTTMMTDSQFQQAKKSGNLVRFTKTLKERAENRQYVLDTRKNRRDQMVAARRNIPKK